MLSTKGHFLLATLVIDIVFSAGTVKWLGLELVIANR